MISADSYLHQFFLISARIYCCMTGMFFFLKAAHHEKANLSCWSSVTSCWRAS
jgi:hypothetical protein